MSDRDRVVVLLYARPIELGEFAGLSHLRGKDLLGRPIELAPLLGAPLKLPQCRPCRGNPLEMSGQKVLKERPWRQALGWAPATFVQRPRSRRSADRDASGRAAQRLPYARTHAAHGIPQDAADREGRVGWLGDGAFVGQDYCYNFDMAGFWGKWLKDIQDGQKGNGAVAVVSPLCRKLEHSNLTFVSLRCLAVLCLSP